MDSTNYSKPIFPNSSQINVLLLLPIIFVEGVVYWDMFKFFAIELKHILTYLIPPKEIKLELPIEISEKISEESLKEILQPFRLMNYSSIIGFYLDISPLINSGNYSKYSSLKVIDEISKFPEISSDSTSKEFVKKALKKINSIKFWTDNKILKNKKFETNFNFDPERKKLQFAIFHVSSKYPIAIVVYLTCLYEADFVMKGIFQTSVSLAQDKIYKIIDEIDVYQK
jgi:hypothetical protein